jgi:hypothetical protein
MKMTHDFTASASSVHSAEDEIGSKVQSLSNDISTDCCYIEALVAGLEAVMQSLRDAVEGHPDLPRSTLRGPEWNHMDALLSLVSDKARSISMVTENIYSQMHAAAQLRSVG